MDRCCACTSREVIADCSSDAKENQEPVDIEITAKSIVSAENDQIVKRSSPKDSSSRKHRRVLHDLDNNHPRRPMHLPRCSLPTDAFRTIKDVIEAKKSRGKATTSSKALNEAPKGNKEVFKQDKGHATAVDEEMDSNRQLEHQESENLAWMDMMLALLEKRYDANSTLSVCVTDLEASNAFQLHQPKKMKTGTSSVQVSFKSRSSLDAASARNDRKKSVTESKQTLHEQEQPQEGKRQRLLLRHAQQIQASSVSSSTSCGCKTGCLKMYCMCFSSRGFCHAGCACDDCKNKNGRTNQSERVEAIQHYITNDPRAFSFASLPQDANATGFLHLLPQKSSSVVLRGCRCKKSKCSKKYCECFQHGMACTSHCRCVDCCNQCETSHLSTAFVHAKRAHYGSTRTLSPGLKPFHPVQITVTKQPRRNCVRKTLRLNL